MQCLHLLQPLLLHFRRDVVAKLARGPGALAHGVGGDVDGVEADIGQQVIGILEVGSRLPGEAHYYVRANSHPGHGLPYALHQAAVALLGVAPPHSLQDTVAAGLCRQADEGAYLLQASHCFYQPIAHVLGVVGEESYAL